MAEQTITVEVADGEHARPVQFPAAKWQINETVKPGPADGMLTLVDVDGKVIAQFPFGGWVAVYYTSEVTRDLGF
jgi:hypothetical protein